MSDTQIRFNDGSAYERFMGIWSKLAGQQFLDWLTPQSNLRWLDVGCGNGAFTQMIIDRCDPKSVVGIDPSKKQIEYARVHVGGARVEYQVGDAMALPFSENTFDVAVMPLVVFFVPEPTVGVAEMVRVVQQGGVVCAYAWDMMEGGFPYDLLWNQMRDMGVDVPLPPSAEASRMDALKMLWTQAGLSDVQVREISVQRTYANFDDYWAAVQGGPSVTRGLSSMLPENLTILHSRMRERLPVDSGERITVTARANAIMGKVYARTEQD